jgi:hypothetical protein
MNLKQIGLCLMFLFWLVEFSSCLEIPNEMQDVINIMLSYQESNYYNKKWRLENRERLFHPDNNALGLSLTYNSLNVPRGELFGTAIFTEFKILEVVKKKDDFVITDKQGEMKKQKDLPCYFVRVQYSLVAHIIDDTQYEVYKDPKDIEWFWIFVSDPNDGEYKLYDELPSFKTRFTSLRAYSGNVDKFAKGEEVLKKIQVK